MKQTTKAVAGCIAAGIILILYRILRTDPPDDVETRVGSWGPMEPWYP